MVRRLSIVGSNPGSPVHGLGKRALTPRFSSTSPRAVVRPEMSTTTGRTGPSGFEGWNMRIEREITTLAYEIANRDDS